MMQAMAQPGFPHPGMAPGHPGMPHGQPMGGMQHPGAGHMGGHPGPGMMQAMHPGVSGPQVTQGQMVTGMPPGAVTSAPGGPIPNAHAMAHMAPGQQPMFQQQPIGFAQMPPVQQQQFLQRRQIAFMHAQAQGHGMPGAMPNMQGLNQAQIAQMKQGMMPQGMQMHMAANPQNFQQQQAHLMAQQHARAQAMHAQRVQAQAQAQAHQMQVSNSQERSTQPPQSHPTPAPQNQSQPQPQPTTQPQQQNQVKQPQAQPTNNLQSQAGQNRPQEGEAQQQQEEPAMNQADGVDELVAQPNVPQNMHGQMILQLFQFQERLQNMERPNQFESWETFVSYCFSPHGTLRQQVFNNEKGTDKRFQIPYAALARFFYSHFSCGIKKIIMSTFDCRETALPNGGHNVLSQNASLTYVYGNGIRVTTLGSVQVLFDATNRIEHMAINTSEWSEYIPRRLLQSPESPDQKQDLKMNKGLKRQQTKPDLNATSIPKRVVGPFGFTEAMVGTLEIVETMTAMGPLFEHYHSNPGISPRDALAGVVSENGKRTVQMNNQMAMMANGGMRPGMNGPNQFQSPAMAHLGAPQMQGSPHLGGPVHTPSPAQNHVGGVSMVHQMSQGGSNLSGSQGPSTNTSPNVSNKRRRASQIKMEDENSSQDVNGSNKVKPSPKIGGKRQKAAQ